MAILLFVTGSASALSSEQQDIYSSGIGFYDAQACSVTLGSVSLLGSDNVEKAYNYFVQQGLPAIASAGILGNLMEESGVDPIKLQGGSETKTPPISNSVGWGIGQWTGTTVQEDLVNKAASKGVDVGDLGFQLDFLWNQINSNPSYYELPQLKAATSPSQAADIFEAGFERADPSQAALPVRESDAEAVYKKYGNSSPVTSSGVTTAASSNSCGNGAASPYTGSGFPFYSQCDPKWGNNPYGGDNICGSGCGPTAMAMIVTALTKQSITPDIMASYYHSKGFDSSGATSWNAAADAAQKYSLTATPLGTNVAKISAALQSGSLVIMAGRGGLPFTSAGHFVVVRGVASDGNWLLGDPDTAPGHSNTQEWDPSQVISGVIQNGGAASVYGISK